MIKLQSIIGPMAMIFAFGFPLALWLSRTFDKGVLIASILIPIVYAIAGAVIGYCLEKPSQKKEIEKAMKKSKQKSFVHKIAT